MLFALYYKTRRNGDDLLSLRATKCMKNVRKVAPDLRGLPLMVFYLKHF